MKGPLGRTYTYVRSGTSMFGDLNVRDLNVQHLNVGELRVLALKSHGKWWGSNGIKRIQGQKGLNVGRERVDLDQMSKDRAM